MAVRVPSRQEEAVVMRCGHEGCLCDVGSDLRFCGEYCEEHSRMGGHEAHVCGCGHAGCPLPLGS